VRAIPQEAGKKSPKNSSNFVGESSQVKCQTFRKGELSFQHTFEVPVTKVCNLRLFSSIIEQISICIQVIFFAKFISQKP